MDIISYSQAFALTLGNIQPNGAEQLGIIQCVGRIAAEDLFGRVDSPSLDVSLKDGYAIQSRDIVAACPQRPITLRLVGAVTAGGDWRGVVHSGEALRILSGAPLPDGADAVISEEFARRDGERVVATNDAHPGRNVLARGADVQRGQLLASKGECLSPPMIGLLAAAGHEKLAVVKRPRVAILATGDEVVAPGAPLPQGKLYASNLVTLAAWCARYGFEVQTGVVRDDEAAIRHNLLDCLDQCDVLLTSGGAWSGERDLVVRILDDLGWQKIYHRVRIGPGKAIGFGLYHAKPVFCLPGGPPSNHMAFLQLALPGLQKMAGYQSLGLPWATARLAESVRGQIDWTQFVHGRLERGQAGLVFHPMAPKSRLQMMAQADAIVAIPEGQAEIPAGGLVQAQVLGPNFNSI
jgi:molybdopterin molybdotransferase